MRSWGVAEWKILLSPIAHIFTFFLLPPPPNSFFVDPHYIFSSLWQAWLHLSRKEISHCFSWTPVSNAFTPIPHIFIPGTCTDTPPPHHISYLALHLGTTLQSLVYLMKRVINHTETGPGNLEISDCWPRSLALQNNPPFLLQIIISSGTRILSIGLKILT